jgi:hypothetical protein
MHALKTCPYVTRQESPAARRRIPCLVAAFMTLTLHGCSYNCNFEARGVIRDASNDRPIRNARVEILDSDGKPHILASGSSAVVTTDAQGQFHVAFWTVPSGKDELIGWTVKLSAEGYEPESIAVGPVKEPKRGDVTVYLVFHASLRKSG